MDIVVYTMLRYVRMALLGVTKEEVKYTNMISRAKPEALMYEDVATLRKEVRRNFGLRALSLLGAGVTAWAVPGVGPGLSTLRPKATAFLLSYRLFTLPITLSFESLSEQICLKRDLSNRPELLRPLQSFKQDLQSINKDARRVSPTGFSGKPPSKPS